MEDIRLHSFPKDFAEYLRDIWENVIGGQYTPPPLPGELQLVSLIETAYLAGLETDELRSLRFTLCGTPVSEVVSQNEECEKVEYWPFAEERAFTVHEVRRLATTTDLDSSAIWIRFPADEEEPLSIQGLVNFGSSWAFARRGYQYNYDQLPHALLLRVEGPGRIIAYQGHFGIASLESGEIKKAGHSPAGDLLGAHRLFSEVQDLLRNDVIPPKYEATQEWHSFEWSAIINVVLAIVNTIQINGHGGALIFLGQSCKYEDLLRIKYRLSLQSDQVRQRFVNFMNMRHKYGDMVWPPQFKDGDAEASEEILRLTSYELIDAQRKLAESCTFVGNLSGTDGAIVIGTDLSVLGFGAEILLDNAPRSEVYSVTDPLRKTKVEGNSEMFGMRHRSAMRLCAATKGLAIFVVSQDGGVSLVWNEEGESCYMEGIRITNANMVLA
ncbi:MAG: hypothetical protein GY774_05910 [Planctomycetes bacterium]|nr:hypothetical protein [Planctomycetota bacterium]